MYKYKDTEIQRCIHTGKHKNSDTYVDVEVHRYIETHIFGWIDAHRLQRYATTERHTKTITLCMQQQEDIAKGIHRYRKTYAFNSQHEKDRYAY